MREKILPLLSSVRFNTYKSFDENEPYRLNLGQNITLIIGRNNCGKSSLIDVVENLVSFCSQGKSVEGMNEVCASFILDERHLERGFSKNTENSIIGNEFRFASQFRGYEFTFKCANKRFEVSDVQDDNRVYIGWYHGTENNKDNWVNCGLSYAQDMKSTAFRRINAERDIVPEIEMEEENVDENGNGATNIIRKYVNTGYLDETIVEKNILTELNKIMEPDAHFDTIRVQQVRESTNDPYKWEIYLGEAGQRYALSKCGSGLKTILLILINLILIPKTQAYDTKEICYAFEEIENNLHPALQKRLFEYLYSFATDNNSKILITSHSHVAINTFYGRNKARIYHVVKNNGHSKVINVESGVQCGQILDDLDVKASDLFQTNGIIWVEGPSDRIYIMHWLKIFTDFSYVEGQHFQFMYYGGKLLSHYEAKEQKDKTDGLINVLTANRHAAIVMDSDKRAQQTSINDTKKRVRQEFERIGYFCWITKGKEIENYVCADAVNKTFGSDLPQIGKYELFQDYIEQYDKHFTGHKTDTARKICKNITLENSQEILDLRQQIEGLYRAIAKWN